MHLTQEQIEKAWMAYCRNTSPRYIAQEIGIHRKTAGKLIAKGYNYRGAYTLPFKERYQVLLDVAQAVADAQKGEEIGLDIAGMRIQLKDFRELIAQLSSKTMEALKTPGFVINNPARAVEVLAKAIKTSIEMEALLVLVDQPDSDSAEEAAKDCDPQNWTPDELLYHAETGKWPSGRAKPGHTLFGGEDGDDENLPPQRRSRKSKPKDGNGRDDDPATIH